MGNSTSADRIAVHCVSMLRHVMRDHLRFEQTYANIVVKYGNSPSTHETIKAVVDLHHNSLLSNLDVLENLIDEGCDGIYTRILGFQIDSIFIHMPRDNIDSAGAVTYHDRRIDSIGAAGGGRDQGGLVGVLDDASVKLDKGPLYVALSHVNALLVSMVLLASKRAQAEMKRGTNPSSVCAVEYFESTCCDKRNEMHDMLARYWDELDKVSQRYFVEFAETIVNVKSELWKELMRPFDIEMPVERPPMPPMEGRAGKRGCGQRGDDGDDGDAAPDTPSYFIPTGRRRRKGGTQERVRSETGRRSRAVYNNSRHHD